MLATGYWLLVIGYWFLVFGNWLLVIGYWLLVARPFFSGALSFYIYILLAINF